MGILLKQDKWIFIAIMIVIVLIAVGLVKKLAWMWGVALFIAVAILVSQPEIVSTVKTTVTSVFSGGIDPLSDYDYSDEAEELDDEIHATQELEKYSK